MVDKKHHEDETHDKAEVKKHKSSCLCKKNPCLIWQIISIVLLGIVIFFLVTGDKSDVNTIDSVNDAEMKMTVLSDENCDICDPTQTIELLKQRAFPDIEHKVIDVNSDEGKEIMEEYDVKALPFFMIEGNVMESKFVKENPDAVQLFKEVNGNYVLPPQAVGASYFIETPEIGDSAVKGDLNAKVTIFEFSEFECPFCGKFIQDAYPKIVENYIDTGKVNLVFKHLPLSFHQHAQKAAEATLCAKEQGKFWEMHDKLFANTDKLDLNNIKIFANDLGLDTEKFNSCLDDGKYAEQIKKDSAEAGNFGISGTPGFMVGNYKVVGAQPYEVFEQAIEQALADI